MSFINIISEPESKQNLSWQNIYETEKDEDTYLI